MMLDGIFDQESYLAAKKMLDYSALQQKVISNNVANINTPGFKRSDVAFSQELSSALEDGDSDSIEKIEFNVFETDDLALRNDGNNVDIDSEMSTLAKNSLLFSMYTQVVRGKLDKLKEAIQQTT